MSTALALPTSESIKWLDKLSLEGDIAPLKEEDFRRNLRRKIDITEITEITDESEKDSTFKIIPDLHYFSAPKDSKNSLRTSLVALAEWEGTVDNIGEELFTARLTEISSSRKSDNYEEEANFLIEDLSDSDIELLQIGAVFRWVIGYSRSVSGTKRRVSQIIMRRLPVWTKRDAKYSKLEGERLSKSISTI